MLATSYDDALHVALSVIDLCDSSWPTFLCHRAPFSSKTLANLGVSRRSGYQVLFPLNRSQPFRNLPPRGWYSLNAGNDHDPSMRTTPIADTRGVPPDTQSIVLNAGLPLLSVSADAAAANGDQGSVLQVPVCIPAKAEAGACSAPAASPQWRLTECRSRPPVAGAQPCPPAGN